jgi:hypothetical protein
MALAAWVRHDLIARNDRSSLSDPSEALAAIDENFAALGI